MYITSPIYFGDKFLHCGEQKKSEKIGEIPQTFERKKLKKTPDDNTVFWLSDKGIADY
jgi:hypothetical protein